MGMATKKRGKKRKDAAMPRTSVSFPPEVYKTLEDLAARKKVSIGWVVRDAVEKYVAEQWPLFSNVKGN
jgi:metal-responsive CopG/Arc/MetJ family transcriptional regulator